MTRRTNINSGSSNKGDLLKQKNNTQSRGFAALRAESGTTIKFVCLLSLFALAILTALVLSCTQGASQMRVLHAYAMSPEGYITNNCAPADFRTFAGNSICYEVYSDSEISVECPNGVSGTVTPSPSHTAGVYTVRVAAATAGEFTIAVTSTGGGREELRFTVLNPATGLERLELRPNQNVLSTTDCNNIDICANGDPNLLYCGDISVTLSKDSWTETYTAADAGTCVYRLNCGYICLNFNGLADADKYDGAVLRVAMGGVSAEVVLQVKDWAVAETCVFADKDPEYYLTSKTVAVTAIIPEARYCSFSLKASEFADIATIERVGVVGGNEKYDILIAFANATAGTVTICTNTQSGTVEHAVSIAAVSKVTNIKITAGKDSYSADETIVVTALLNGTEGVTASLDWYVNDELVATGAKLEYAAESGKAISVYAKCGDVVSNTLAINVAYSTSEMIVWYIVFGLAVLVMIGLLVFKSKRKTFISSMSLIDRARKFAPRYRTYMTKYKRHQFFDLVYDIANLREDVLINFAETKDLSFDKASRDLSSAHKIAREIYKAPKVEKQLLFVERQAAFEKHLDEAIAALQEFANKHPEEAIFNFKKKPSKKKNTKTQATQPAATNVEAVNIDAANKETLNIEITNIDAASNEQATNIAATADAQEIKTKAAENEATPNTLATKAEETKTKATANSAKNTDSTTTPTPSDSVDVGDSNKNNK